MDLVRVLVVDDDDIDREKICRLLKKVDLPVDIYEAASADEARHYLNTTPFDCVFLDYQLRDALGVELLLEIKEHSNKPCPVIMITGLAEEHIPTEAMREGVYEYFSKNYLKVHHLSTALEGGLRWAALTQRLMQSESHLEYLNLYDQLTQLPNHSLFLDRLDQSMLTGERTSIPFVVLVIDLDLFQEINHSLGYEAGDLILAKVAERLKKSVRKSDTVARLKSDTFACLLQGTSQQEHINQIIEKISQSMAKPFMLNEQAITIKLSIGAAQFPIDGRDRSSLLNKADQAMYTTKIKHAQQRIL